jgi:hypothetical protein
MPPNANQRALISQFMSITGLPEKTATRVSLKICLETEIMGKGDRTDSSFLHSTLKLQIGRLIRRLTGKTHFFHFVSCSITDDLLLGSDHLDFLPTIMPIRKIDFDAIPNIIIEEKRYICAESVDEYLIQAEILNRRAGRAVRQDMMARPFMIRTDIAISSNANWKSMSTSSDEKLAERLG